MIEVRIFGIGGKIAMIERRINVIDSRIDAIGSKTGRTVVKIGVIEGGRTLKSELHI